MCPGKRRDLAAASRGRTVAHGDGHHVRPTLLNSDVERTRGADRSGGDFEIPVAAEIGGTRRIVAGRDVSAGQLAEPIEEGPALRVARDVATVQQQIDRK